jgi:predicted ATPase/transcriptional regulator with XRE-family HTH domain
MSDSRTFGGWLHQQRHARGVTQDELAEHLGFSAALLRKLEAGERRPSGQIAELLADYFCVPADERAAFVAFARTGPATGADVGTISGAGSPRAPWRSAYLHQTNLPALLAPLIGREREGAAATNQLRHPKTRLLTLTGPPGIGKTRLGLHVAVGLVGHFADGVFFVDLAPVSDPDLVLPTVARTLGLQEAGDQPIARVLLGYVRGQRMLLLLDNFEQVLDAALAVVRLLEASPWLKVLVTSREALHVRGERRFPVPPLGLPDLQQLPALAELAGYPAVALFVERAQAVDPEFALTEENAADVAAVCIGLGGVPLAIELAAARARHLTPQAMRHALSSHLKLLTGGARDLPVRQQTISGAIAWSYNLLEETEQRLFRSLGVFVGGFTADALDGISAGSPDAPASTLDTLLSLSDKYLVQEDRPPAPLGGVRFALLEAIREYALEQLATHGETAEIRRRHTAYYLALAEQAESQLWGPQQARWLDRLESEHDNLRAALGWATAHDPAAAQRSAAAIWGFWMVRGYWSEGREQLAAALTAAASLDPATTGRDRARALYGAGFLAQEQGDLPAALDLLEQSLTLARECDDQLTVARTLRSLGDAVSGYGHGDLAAARDFYEQSLTQFRKLGDQRNIAMGFVALGNIALAGGDYTAARTLLEDSLTRFQKLDDARLVGHVLGNLGWLAGHQGDYPTARTLLEQGLALHRELGDKGFIAYTIQRQGYVAKWQGDYQAARVLAEQGLALSQEVGDRGVVFNSLLNLGSLADAEGDHTTAAGYFQRALRLAQDLRMTSGMAECLAGLGGAAVGQGQPGGAQRGARLRGAAAALLPSHGDTRPPWARREHEHWLAAARAALGDAAFAAAFTAGQALPFAEAVALAADD